LQIVNLKLFFSFSGKKESSKRGEIRKTEIQSEKTPEEKERKNRKKEIVLNKCIF